MLQITYGYGAWHCELHVVTVLHACVLWVSVLHACVLWLSVLHACVLWLSVLHACVFWVSVLHACVFWVSVLHACGLCLEVNRVVLLALQLLLRQISRMDFKHMCSVVSRDANFEVCVCCLIVYHYLSHAS